MTILVRRERTQFRAWARDHQAVASSATCAARAAAARAFGVPEGRVHIDAVAGTEPPGRLILKARIFEPASAVAWQLLGWSLFFTGLAAAVAYWLGFAR